MESTIKDQSHQYDAIVIGSGMGGMSVAGILARQFRKKVLIVEKHSKIGGFTHIFKRPKPLANSPNSDLKYEFDVGVHYVGEMNEQSPLRKVMDFITESQVKWNPMPDTYDVVQFPEIRFGFEKGSKRLIQSLVRLFPEEEKAIHQYFKDIRLALRWLAVHQMGLNFGGPVGKALGVWNAWQSKLPLMPLKNYLDQNFIDSKLKAILAAQWGDYGIVPSKCPLATHAVIVNHYLEGAFYPDGGSSKIGSSVQKVVEKANGKVLLRTEVKKVLTEKSVAMGIETVDGQTFYAPLVYSNIGLPRTYQSLLGMDVPDLAKAATQEDEYTVVTLYLGFKGDPKSLGILGENHWIYSSLDHEEVWNRRDELVAGKAHVAYVSFPSMKDGRNHSESGLHTAEVIAPISRAVFSKWDGTTKSKRGDDYVKAKEQITRGLLELVESKIPGFIDAIDFKELATPLTVEHYTSHGGGAIYGVPAVKSRYLSGCFRPKTEIKGLYLCGSDAAFLGIGGTLMSGLVAVGRSIGWKKTFRILA